MKRFYVGLLVICTGLLFSLTVSGQDKLTSEALRAKGREMDGEIAELSKKIEELVKKYNLLKQNKSIKILPYQTALSMGDNYIKIEKHSFIKDDLYKRSVIGIKIKSIKLYTGGQSVSKIESVIYENNHNNETSDRVKIIDPSPTTSNTSDISLKRTKQDSVVLEKNLGEIKNTTAFPVRNDIKRDFLIPHLTEFYNVILFIAESHSKSLKDSDTGMAEFLKKSSRY